MPYPSSTPKFVFLLEPSEIDLIVGMELSFLGSCGRVSVELPLRAELPFELEVVVADAELPHSDSP